MDRPAIADSGQVFYELFVRRLSESERDVRPLYGLRWTPAHALAFRAAERAARGSVVLAPPRMRSGWNTRFFDDVAKTERARIARGEVIRRTLV
jgi:hypothetical protein